MIVSESAAGESATSRAVDSKHFVIKPLSVDEAILQIEEEGTEVLVFRDASDERTKVLYKPPEGIFGLTDPKN